MICTLLCIADLSYRGKADRGGPFYDLYSQQGACTAHGGAGDASARVEGIPAWDRSVKWLALAVNALLLRV